MKMDLEVFTSFKASHSLAGFETPHYHLWKLEVCFSVPFPLKDDRVLDLIMLQNTLNKITQPIEGVYLNSYFNFSPTSENLSNWIADQVKQALPNAPLTSVCVALCSLDGECMGKATLRL